MQWASRKGVNMNEWRMESSDPYVYQALTGLQNKSLAVQTTEDLYGVY